MPYNLTEDQKYLVRWMVEENQAGNLPREFSVMWGWNGGRILQYQGDHPELTQGDLNALDAAELVMSDINIETKVSTSGSKRPKFRERQVERSRRCRLTAKAFEAVDNDFDAPDMDFVRQLTPLADVTSMDDEIKQRACSYGKVCQPLPDLNAGVQPSHCT